MFDLPVSTDGSGRLISEMGKLSSDCMLETMVIIFSFPSESYFLFKNLYLLFKLSLFAIFVLSKSGGVDNEDSSSRLDDFI